MVMVIRKQFGIPNVKLALKWDFKNCYTNSINMLITFFLSHLKMVMIGYRRLSLCCTRTPHAASERARTPPPYLKKKIARLLQHSCAGPLAAGCRPRTCPMWPSPVWRRCTCAPSLAARAAIFGCSAVRVSIHHAHCGRGGRGDMRMHLHPINLARRQEGEACD